MFNQEREWRILQQKDWEIYKNKRRFQNEKASWRQISIDEKLKAVFKSSKSKEALHFSFH